METMETMETLENHGNHGNHGNRRCGIETVANHIEIMETVEKLRKHRPRSGGTSEPNLEVQANPRPSQILTNQSTVFQSGTSGETVDLLSAKKRFCW